MLRRQEQLSRGRFGTLLDRLECLRAILGLEVTIILRNPGMAPIVSTPEPATVFPYPTMQACRCLARYGRLSDLAIGADLNKPVFSTCDVIKE